MYKPYNKLSKDEINTLWEGNEHFTGINKFFKYLEKKIIKFKTEFFYQGTVVKHFVINVREVD